LLKFVGVPESYAGSVGICGEVVRLRTSDRGNPDFFRSGTDERAGALAGGCAGGHDVIDQQNFATGDDGGVGDFERPSQTSAALVRSQREERLRVSYTHKQLRCLCKVPFRREFFQAAQSG
jgi:hypothetical protein